jgi:hypothetical protein
MPLLWHTSVVELAHRGFAEVAGYPGGIKVKVCQRLIGRWEDVADHCNIPPHTRAGFPQGREPHRVWEYMEATDDFALFEEALAEYHPDVLSILHAGAAPPQSPSAAPHPPIEIDIVSTVTFDLTDIKKAIIGRLDSLIRGIVAFSVPYGDGIFLTNVCDYLASFGDQTVCKQPNPLTADISSAEEVVQILSAYRDEELQSADVIFPIHAEGVPIEIIVGFLEKLEVAMGTLRRRLILLIVVAEGTPPIVGVCALPAPRVTREDLSMWLRDRLEILRAHANHTVPAAIVHHWAEAIAKKAHTERGLNLRSVYDHLERTLLRFHDDPEAFVTHMMEGA